MWYKVFHWDLSCKNNYSSILVFIIYYFFPRSISASKFVECAVNELQLRRCVRGSRNQVVLNLAVNQEFSSFQVVNWTQIITQAYRTTCIRKSYVVFFAVWSNMTRHKAWKFTTRSKLDTLICFSFGHAKNYIILVRIPLAEQAYTSFKKLSANRGLQNPNLPRIRQNMCSYC